MLSTEIGTYGDYVGPIGEAMVIADHTWIESDLGTVNGSDQYVPKMSIDYGI